MFTSEYDCYLDMERASFTAYMYHIAWQFNNGDIDIGTVSQLLKVTRNLRIGHECSTVSTTCLDDFGDGAGVPKTHNYQGSSAKCTHILTPPPSPFLSIPYMLL